MRTLFCIPLLLLVCAPVFARDAEGRLSGIITPNGGRPASCGLGETFEVLLDFQPEAAGISAEIRGEGGAFACEVQGIKPNQHTKQSTLTLKSPEAAPPGLYALRLTHAGHTLEMPRAVYLTPPGKTHFVLACLSNIRFGGEDSGSHSARVVGALNQSGADGAVIIGNLTQNGHPKEYRALLGALAHSTMPTWLVPGPEDNRASQFAQFFGAPACLVRIGQDALLIFDTGTAQATAPGGAQAGLLHQYRREARAARWTIAVTHNMDRGTNLRYPITLFVDDPVDVLLHTRPPAQPAEGDTPLAELPWGDARILSVPDSKVGEFLVLDLLDGGVLPRPPQAQPQNAE